VWWFGKKMNENLMEKTVQNALRKFNQSNSGKGERSQFNQLYNRIVNSGELEMNLTAQHRHSLDHKWESGSSIRSFLSSFFPLFLSLDNKIEMAQSQSSLYSSSGLTAPPLKKEKSAKSLGLGKGWFDLQVNSPLPSFNIFIV
jgi:hypothetical protein